MLVYGDLSQPLEVGREILAIADELVALRTRPPSLARHAGLVALLLRAGAVLQAVADAEFGEARQDRLSDRQTALMSLSLDLADAVCRSWQSGFAACPALASGEWLRLAEEDRELRLEARIPEGFAFYAVYPECYAEAARASGLPRNTRVIGLRSIGTSLATIVAAALGSRDVVTLRPVGPVFERRLCMEPALRDAVLAGGAAAYAIVDEGPGLSGSSFVAVLDLLREAGVERERIVLFPSHAGAPGRQASARIRARFDRARRVVRTFDDTVLKAPNVVHRLERWLQPLIGRLEAPLADISGGAWRALHYASARQWPAVHPFQERRKFLAQTAQGFFLIKFIGLGQEGERKFRLARQLHSAGYCPRPIGFCHGFTVEVWHSEASPLVLGDADPIRLAEHVGGYLAWRATHATPGPHRGASCALLLEMAQRNVREGLCADAADRLQNWQPRLPDLERQVRRLATDNRMQAQEWLVTRDGTLLKTDAVDHHASHDLIGCQDLSWDIAGACFELQLDGIARERLLAVLEAETGGRPSAELLLFLQICYCAFRLGAATMARDAHADAEEARRAEAVLDRCRRELACLLNSTPAWSSPMPVGNP